MLPPTKYPEQRYVKTAVEMVIIEKCTNEITKEMKKLPHGL